MAKQLLRYQHTEILYEVRLAALGWRSCALCSRMAGFCWQALGVELQHVWYVAPCHSYLSTRMRVCFFFSATSISLQPFSCCWDDTQCTWNEEYEWNDSPVKLAFQFVILKTSPMFPDCSLSFFKGMSVQPAPKLALFSECLPLHHHWRWRRRQDLFLFL